MKKNISKILSNLFPDFGDYLNVVGEIAVRNEVPVLEVARTYNRFSDKVYKCNLNIIGNVERNPSLDYKIFQLTERYLDIKRIKNLNKLY